MSFKTRQIIVEATIGPVFAGNLIQSGNEPTNNNSNKKKRGKSFDRQRQFYYRQSANDKNVILSLYYNYKRSIHKGNWT